MVSLQQSTHLFEINPGARWYYEWESAATKAQRFTKHVLRVYVLERSVLSHRPPHFAPPTAGNNNAMLRVVAVASSSEFMVVSYRRATSEIRADRRILAMLVDSASSSQAAAALLASSVDGDSDGGLLPFDAVPALLQRVQFAAATGAAATAAGEKHTLFPSLHQRTSPTTTSQDSSPLRYPVTAVTATATTSTTQIQDHGDLMWQEKKLWESSHPETLMLTKHLAIIYHFLASADATRFTHCLSQWSALFADQWGSPQSPGHAQAYLAFAASASAQRYHPYGSPDRSDSSHRAPVGTSTNTKISWYFMMKLASSMSQAVPYRVHARGGGRGTTGEELHAERLALLVETCADVAGWLVFDVDNIRLFRRVFAEYAPTLLNKDALRGTFVNWVRLVYDLIGHFLASSSTSNGQLASTQALVEDIITIVFKSDALEALRPKVLSILSSTSMQGLAGFVAQVRSHFVKKSQLGGPSSPDGTSTRSNMALTRVLQGFMSPLHGRWHFDGAQTVVEPLDRSGAHGISLGGMLDWLRECSVVTIDVQDEDQLAIRSLWGTDSTTAGGDEHESNAMKLIADGHARVFSHFPSGLSSMLTLGDRRYGDYQASFVAPDALALELYAWSETGESEGFYARESATPAWGSERGDATTTQSAVRWKLRLSLERFGRPTAAPGASILRVEAVVERGVLCASRASALEMDTLQGRLGAIDDWKALYQVSATYRRVQ